MRANIQKDFSKISRYAQGDLNFKIAVVGPESTGKTTLSKALAEQLFGRWNPEYARTYLEHHGNYYSDEMLPIFLAGNKSQYQMAATSGKLFNVFDTDSLTTRIWCDFLKNDNFDLEQCNKYIEDEVYDLTFLMSDNIPFVSDPQRYGGDKRQLDLNHFKKHLDNYNRKYIVVNETDVEQRLAFMLEKVYGSVGKTSL